ncbi:uncharacterized protein OCT59_010514 [Rhizophagus irregularis]|uniref:uncharacterized protein n=1 Tax=Rhizophagus irregularis TaxID=588596 RepID=UPI00332A8E54|nr:hypothetical protein OCT59_010514 [Rhizophagus irregularis]
MIRYIVLFAISSSKLTIYLDKVDDKRNHAPKNDKNAGESSIKLNTSNDFNDINQKIKELLKKWEALLVDARKKKQKITDLISIDVQDGRNTADILPFNADEHEDSDISPLLNNRDNQELELSGSILDEPQLSKKVAKKSYVLKMFIWNMKSSSYGDNINYYLKITGRVI